MFIRYYLIALIILNVSLPNLVANPAIDQSPEEVTEVIIEDTPVKKCTTCNDCFDFKKIGKAFLRGSLFFAETFILYEVSNYLYSKYYERDLYLNFNEALLYCLVWELAGQAEGFPSLFREKDKNVCVK